MQSWWVNGVATGLDPGDRGLAYGDGLFETMAARDGGVPWIDYHLERLAAGCARLSIPAPSRDALRRDILARAQALDRAVIKLIVTRGPGARGYRPPAGARPTIVIGTSSWPAEPREHYTDGIEMVTCRTRLGENPKLAGLKHLCRLEQVVAQIELQERGMQEGLLQSSSGLVVSGTSNNVFAVCGARVRTPRIDRCGVRGVMRRLVLETCAALGLEHEEIEMDRDTVQSAAELFVTNAIHGIRPVRRLDDRDYRVGSVTRRLAAALAPKPHA